MIEFPKLFQEYREHLDAFLAPYLGIFNNKSQREKFKTYIQGLFANNQRKSMESIADMFFKKAYQNVQHFITDAPYDTEALFDRVAVQANSHLGGRKSCAVLDDTANRKKGKETVGASKQYIGELGKVDNCQSIVSISLVRGSLSMVVALRLFLPKKWISDLSRLVKCKVPEAQRVFKTKIEIAQEELERLIRCGVEFGMVLCDAGYGKSSEFRNWLSKRGLFWALGVPSDQRVYPISVKLVVPEATGRGRPRVHPVPDQQALSCSAMFSDSDLRKLKWRDGSKGAMTGWFAARRVRVAEGRPVKMPGGGPCPLPGEEELWLVAERDENGTFKFHLSNLPANATLLDLVSALKQRWVCEQVHQQLKEEFGLDHFEGRSWNGLHRHMVFAMIALNFMQSLRIKQNRIVEEDDNARKNHCAEQPLGNLGRSESDCGPDCPLPDGFGTGTGSNLLPAGIQFTESALRMSALLWDKFSRNISMTSRPRKSRQLTLPGIRSVVASMLSHTLTLKEFLPLIQENPNLADLLTI